jgi:UDP-N-acetyl-D-glucosamine dehydrogenase
MIEKPTNARYEVAIVGLGYVGIPLALGFSEAGCCTLGYDLDKDRITELQGRRSPLTNIPASRLKAVMEKELLHFTSNKGDLAQSQAIIICVPTPLRTHLDPDIAFILAAGEEIAPLLRKGMLVSLESSTYPGTTAEDLRRILEMKSGLKAGIDFALAFSPEREDPGNEESILKEMPKVVGGFTPSCLERAVELYSRAVSHVIPVSSCSAAEAVKLTENIFRFVNIALVNELKRIYTPMGIDIWEVIEAAETKPFGFMAFYPSAGVGGHCIPIDPYYLTWKAREFNLDTKLIDLAGQINRGMPYYVVTHVVEALSAVNQSIKGSRILLLGVAYKPNISDDRESPSYEVMELLHKKGAEVDYYDPYVPEILNHGATKNWVGKRSIVWKEIDLSYYSAAVVCTAHSGVDYAELADRIPLIIDTCNIVPKNRNALIIPA